MCLAGWCARMVGWSQTTIPMLGFEHPTDKNHGFLTVTSSVQDHGLV